MIEKKFEDVHSKGWLKRHGIVEYEELCVLRQVIPWQKIVGGLSKYYDETKGRFGVSLRMIVAVLILGKLEQKGDKEAIKRVRTCRYAQYFCNVPDGERYTFMDRSSLVRFRQRIGSKGCQWIEACCFENFRRCGAIKNDASLIDSSSLPNNIIYPNDVDLIYKAFGKIVSWARQLEIPLWWNHRRLKQRWRAYNLGKKKNRLAFLLEFHTIFAKVAKTFQKKVRRLGDSQEKKKGKHWYEVFRILKNQTRQKLRGEQSIENRLVSLDELDARPIKKGKAFPRCEFGTTNQMSFNRQGFMVSAEVFIGQPNDKTLYKSTLEQYQKKMKAKPPGSVTDKGYRSPKNFEIAQVLEYACFGKLKDIPEEIRDFCKSARSATEGFIAVAKNLRGMGKSLYRGVEGDRCWAALGQTAYNLKKFYMLWEDEALTEFTLQRLGFIT